MIRKYKMQITGEARIEIDDTLPIPDDLHGWGIHSLEDLATNIMLARAQGYKSYLEIEPVLTEEEQAYIKAVNWDLIFDPDLDEGAVEVTAESEL